jgi:Protein of unknown function (DUF3301)
VLENILFIAFIGLVWFWFDSVGARDTAISKGKDLTDRTNLQFLDESVACTRIRLARNSKGHVQILRIYDFDVSASGGDRMHCQLTLLGQDLHAWYIPPYLQAVH